MSKKLKVVYLGGYEFDIDRRRVAFHKVVKANRRNYVAALSFDGGGDAVDFASLLNAAGIRAELANNIVKLDAESLVGLMIRTGAVPPGFLRLYASPRLHVFAEVDKSELYFYFAVIHNGVWRALKGMYGANRISLWTKECDLAEKLWGEIADALHALGMPPNALPLIGRYDGRCHISLHVPHLSRFLQHAAEGVEAEPADVSLEGNFLRIRTEDVEAKFEFELAKGSVVKYIAVELPKALKLYKALKALGVPAGLTPDGVRLSGKAVWALLALTVDRVKPVAEVLPNVLLAGKYDVGDRKLFAFVYMHNDGIAVRFVLKDSGWKSAGGYLRKTRVDLRGNVVEVTDAINAVYAKMGVGRRVAAKGNVLSLSLRDLTLLGLKAVVIRLVLERAKKYLNALPTTGTA